MRRLRQGAAISAREASGRVGMNLRHWQKIEAAENNTTLKTLARLSLALKVDPAELLADDAQSVPVVQVTTEEKGPSRAR